MRINETQETRRLTLPGLARDDEKPSRLKGLRTVQIGLGVTLILLAGVVAFSFWSSRELTSATRALANAYTLRQLQGEIFTGLGDADYLQWGLVLADIGVTPAEMSPPASPPPGASPSPGAAVPGRADLLEIYEASLVNAARALEEARQLTIDDPFLKVQDELVAELEPLVLRRIEYFNRVDGFLSDGSPQAAMRMLLSGEGMILSFSIRELFDRMTEGTQLQIQERLDHADRTAASARVAALVGLALAALLVVLVGAMVRSDLLKRHRTEFALRRSEKELHEFLNGMPLGVIVVNASGKIVYTNPLSDRLLPASLKALPDGEAGTDDLPLFIRGTDEPYPVDRLPFARALAGESTMVEDVELRLDGRLVPLHVSAEPIRNASGGVAFAVATFVDISQRLEAQDQLIRAKQMAEEASRAKSDFLARMSHELRTPLNSVIGFTNVLLKNKHERLVTSDLFYLERIRYGGCHLLDVINGILDLARIEAGRLEIQLSEVRLDELVRETLGGFEGQLTDRPIQLEYDGPSTPVHTVTDALKFRQILINLVGNALKFTERGTVTVELATDTATGDPVRLGVRDTGMGIPPERLDAIFHAFEQVDSGTDRRHDGTGLGLTITKALCEELGYRLEVESEIGEGSVFSIVFPPEGVRVRPRVEQAGDASVGSEVVPTTAAASFAVGEEPLVLVVDDEEDARYLVVEMLQELGYRTVSATNHLEALETARIQRPDLITLDLFLGDESGVDTVRALQADPDLQEIPVLLVTVAADDFTARVTGIAEVLQKPLDRERFVGAVRRHLPEVVPVGV